MGKTQTTSIIVAFEGQDAKMTAHAVQGMITKREEVNALLKWGNREEFISKGGCGFTS